MSRQETIGDATLYLGDCLEILPALQRFDAVVTDPPYPNNAGHFDGGIDAARTVLMSDLADSWTVFWDEMETPECYAPLVAKHVWHRTNTNRPDNYEAIYQFESDGKKRASRVFPFAVIAPRLTGCVEATGHPTQKNERLMANILAKCHKTALTILDPFMGSGTTGVAAVNQGKKFTGIEIDKFHFEAACERIEAAHSQGRLFA